MRRNTHANYGLWRYLLASSLLASIGSTACSSKDAQGDSGDSGSGGSGFNVNGGSGTAGTGSIFGTGSASGAGGSAGSGTDCGQSKLEAQARAVNVAIVLDRSLSMNTALSATEPKTRWQATRQALNVALTAVQDRISFGLKLFPDGTADCSVSNPGLTVDIRLGAT